MRAPSSRQLWTWLALAAAVVALTSVALTVWFALHPCHLCIVQRTVFFLLAPLAALAAWRPAARGAAGLSARLFLALAAFGGGVAVYQSWLQWQPLADAACVAGPLGPLERLVEWLGARWPSFFLATGFCADKQLTILGFSLANWAGALFAALLALGFWAWRRSRV